jgi:hypothetical protein
MSHFTKAFALPLAAVAGLMLFAGTASAVVQPVKSDFPATPPRPSLPKSLNTPSNCNAACQANKATGGGKFINTKPTPQPPRPVMSGNGGHTATGNGPATAIRLR